LSNDDTLDTEIKMKNENLINCAVKVRIYKIMIENLFTL